MSMPLGRVAATGLVLSPAKHNHVDRLILRPDFTTELVSLANQFIE
jgi:hypothetical protein